MSGVASAVAAAGIGSAVIGSKAAKKAAKTQAKSADAGITEQRRQFDILQQQQQPWIQAGTTALNKLQDPTAFTASPDYAFRQSEGTNGINNSFAARGGALSGNALKALTEFNSNLASGEYGNWWNRQAGLAGVGQAATNNVGQAGINMANNVSNILGQQGDARASGIIGSANAIQGGIGDIASIYGYYKAGGFGAPRGTPPIWSGNYGYGNAPNVRVG